MKILPFGAVYEPVKTVVLPFHDLTNSCFSPSLRPRLQRLHTTQQGDLDVGAVLIGRLSQESTERV